MLNLLGRVSVSIFIVHEFDTVGTTVTLISHVAPHWSHVVSTVMYLLIQWRACTKDDYFLLLCTQDLESCRQVQFDEVMDYCKSIGCPLVETSAKVQAMLSIVNYMYIWGGYTVYEIKLQTPP